MGKISSVHKTGAAQKRGFFSLTEHLVLQSLSFFRDKENKMKKKWTEMEKTILSASISLLKHNR